MTTFNCYLLDGEFKKQKLANFDKLVKTINERRTKLYQLELSLIIDLLHQLGKEVLFDKKINSLEGIVYLSSWLKKDNLKKICKLNFFDEKNSEILAQPRGVVCHWIAGNIPTLAFFSLVLAILSKNGSILKIPKANQELLLYILKKLSRLKINYQGKSYSGRVIVKSIAVVSFSSQSQKLSQKLSLAADCKVVWGGAKAVKSIIALPQKEHCETIFFGPKYSFAIFDKKFIESNQFEKALLKSALDVVLFKQMACSSPHVFFFEKSKYPLIEIAQKIKTSFEKLDRKYFKKNLSEKTISKIINARGFYSLDVKKNIIKSPGLDWTILINKKISLEEPIQGRTIFLKEVKNIDQILPLITRKVQALSLAVLNQEKRKAFAKKATFCGVDRIVPPGKMHNFDIPWDGVLILSRLVRWVILKD